MIEKIEKARMTFEALKKQYPAILECAQVAKLLNTQESTIRQWTRKGKIPHRKLGGFTRYMLADLAFWLNSDIDFRNKNEERVEPEQNNGEKRKRGRPRKEEILKRQGLI